MRPKVALALVAGMVVVLAIIAARQMRLQRAQLEPPQVDFSQSAKPADVLRRPSFSETPSAVQRTRSRVHQSASGSTSEEAVVTNKVERLAQIRETYRALAAGDPAVALRAAKEITDGTERETALLALVTEWTAGELRPPLDRARDIGSYGLEAGLGMELVKNPDLALQWANEMTDGLGRATLVQQTAIAMTGSDPAAAFALAQQLPESDRGKFFDAVFAGWAENDTEAALQRANQLDDPVQRDSALQAIRSVAPVGIGAALRMDDGYAVINQLLPGTPAELSGQLHPGDRILALAQGDNSFVDLHGMALKDLVDMIRGAPGTVIQLQVQSTDAPPGSPPQIISVTRDQIKYKR